MADTVGFIGLGIMGKPMAENLIEAGYDLVVYNRTREKAEDLDGATVAESPKEVAENSDIIITMLPDSPQVEEMLLGEAGVLEGVGEGAVIVDMSTISPVITEELSEKAAEKGASMLDALTAGVPTEPLARYFEYWLLRLQGVYPEVRSTLSPDAVGFLTAVRSVPPHEVGGVPADTRVLRELENVHRALIATHLEKSLKSDRVLRELRKQS